ncbi:ArsR family transcriptional regulator [Cupriavidus sp. 30B13]|uniref:ArsR family transcriptional regulator n=1 Tax=Cupriavidus sp. 30B13 TaxID=3384241 RepID=UPI003B8F182D
MASQDPRTMPDPDWDPQAHAALLNILAACWESSQAADGRAMSLARLRKRTGLPMSELRRTLVDLEEGELLAVRMEPDGATGTVWLTEGGTALCRELFGA